MCVLLNIEFFIAINHFLKRIFRPFIYIVFSYCLVFRKFIKKILMIPMIQKRKNSALKKYYS